MKAFALAVVAAAGLLCSAGTADAQFRSRGSYRTYSYPTYTYPTYSYPTYSYPTYTSVVPTYTSVVPTYDNGVVVTSGYTPAYTAPVYPSGSYYPSSFGSYPSYYSGYSGYSGTYVSPYGYMGGRRGWRW
jgi:hypothetical protein